jgi:hypothetical protein
VIVFESTQQRDIILHALVEAGFQGSSKITIGQVEMEVRNARIVPPQPDAAPADAPPSP